MPDYGDQILTNRKILVLGPETTKGDKLTLTNAHIRSTALEASVEVNPATFNRNLLLPTFSQVASLKGSPIGKLTCKTEIKGSGGTYLTLGADAVPAPTLEPACGRLLRACGFRITSGTAGGLYWYNYTPTSTPLTYPTQCPTWTMGVWNDGVMETIYGAKGNARITCRKDEPVMLETEFLGIYYAMEDKTLASWSTVTFESTVPPVAKDADCTVALGNVSTVTIANGGSGYTLNDVLTIVQSGASGCTLTATGVTAGAVTGVTLTTAGLSYSVANGLATTVAPPGGTACTINITAIAATPIDLASFEIDMGNQVALQTSVNSSTGLLWTEIVGRKPTMRLDPAQHVPTLSGAALDGEVQWYSRLLSGDALGTTGVITLGPFSTGVNYVPFTITLPNARVTSVRPGDREGLRVSEIELELCGSTYAGEDEITIMFDKT